jgi:endonuclease G, mitochondrial
MTFAYLDDQTLLEVQRAAIELGFADDGQLAALNAGISPAFIATYSQGGNAQARLITLTSRMNATRVLVSGEVPLTKWLNKAILMAAGVPQETVFRRALEQASADGVAPPAVAADGAGAVPGDLDVAALPVADGGLEVQIDEDDTLGVGFLHDGTTASRSVAKLLIHRHFDGNPSMLAGNQPDLGLGTGWLLAPRLLITNFHVVDARLPKEAPASAGDFLLQAAATQALFDFYHDGSQVQATQVVSCVASDPELDYALLRLPEDAPRRPPLRLRASHIAKPKDRALQERVNVLQHRGGDPMRLGFRNNFLVTGTESRLSYLTDTAGGSSGSPICDDAWFVAALHRGFTTIPGGPLTVWGKEIRQENYGTPIGRILAHLATSHPDLREEVEIGQAAWPQARTAASSS